MFNFLCSVNSILHQVASLSCIKGPTFDAWFIADSATEFRTPIMTNSHIVFIVRLIFGPVLLPAAIYRQSAPHCHFGYDLSASLAASDSRDVHLFTYVQPSGAFLDRPRIGLAGADKRHPWVVVPKALAQNRYQQCTPG